MTVARSPAIASGACQQGFSLIELLVALLIVVMLTTVVSLNVGSGGRDIERTDEVRHFAALLGYAQTEAELSGVDHGLYLEANRATGETRYRGYWLRRYDQGWAEPRGSSEIFEPFLFEPGVELSLSLIANPDVVISNRDPELNPDPQIVLFAGGEATEGELDWIDARTGELLYRVEWDLFGRTRLLPRGEEPSDDDR